MEEMTPRSFANRSSINTWAWTVRRRLFGTVKNQLVEPPKLDVVFVRSTIKGSTSWKQPGIPKAVRSRFFFLTPKKRAVAVAWGPERRSRLHLEPNGTDDLRVGVVLPEVFQALP